MSGLWPFSSSSTPSQPEQLDKSTFPGIVENDIVSRLQQLTSTIEEYKLNNTQKMIKSITNYDESDFAKKNPQIKINLSKDLINKVVSFHSNILNNQEDLQDMKKLKDEIEKHYRSELGQIQKRLESDPDYKNNQLLKTNLNSVVENIIQIRTNNSYFRYKYMQTTIFNLYFIQLVFNILDKYTSDVTDYIVKHSKYREGLMKKFMQEVVDMMKSPDNLEFSEADTAALNTQMNRITQQFKDKEHEVVEKMRTMKDGVSEQVVNTLNSTGPKSILRTSSLPANTNFIPRTTSFNSQSSNNRRATYGGKTRKQRGGFIRDLSELPKNFFDIGT